LTSGTFIFGAKPNPQIPRHHSADSYFDHGNAKANIDVGPSALALGQDNQSIQKVTYLVD